MTKQIKKTGKRSLAVFLSILMLMTSWVFVAPSAFALQGGKYTVRILVKNTNDFTPGSNQSITIYYRKNDGSGTDSSHSFNIGNGDGNGRTKVFDSGGANYNYYPSPDGVELDGIPTGATLYLEKTSNGWFWDTDGGGNCWLQIKVNGSWPQGTYSGNNSISDNNTGGAASGSYSKSGKGTFTGSIGSPALPSYTLPAVTWPSSITIAKNTTSKTASCSISPYNPSDQYGVWQGHKWSTDNTLASIAENGNSGGTITANASSNHLDYTFNAYCKFGYATRNEDVRSKQITVYVPHNITINPNGGSYNGSTSNTTIQMHTNENTTLSTPTRTGYHFTGWTTTGGTVNGNSFTAANHNSTLTANWEINQYTITFNDWNGVQLKSGKVNHGVVPTKPTNPTRDSDADKHYTFSAWDPTVVAATADATYVATYTGTNHNWNSGVVTKTPTCKETGTKVFTCQTSSCGRTRTDTLEIDPNYHANYGTEIRGYVAPTCETAGYTGDTYCKGCGVKLQDGSEIPALGHDWGVWTPDTNGTTHTRVCQRVASHTETVAHNFGAWTEDGAGNHTHVCQTCNHSQTEKISYTVNYTASEANVTNLPDPFTKVYGTNATLSSVEPQRPGYTFSGWKISGDTYAKGGTMSTDYTVHHGDSVNLVAQWLRGNYTVTYTNTNTDGSPVNAEGDTAFTGAISVVANDQHHLNGNISVSVGGNVLAQSAYTYSVADDKMSATLQLAAAQVVGAIVIDAGTDAHSFEYVSISDTQHKQVCSDCGYEKAPVNHDFRTAGTTEGSCVTQGTVSYECHDCGKTKTEETGLVPTHHPQALTRIAPKTPNCTEEGNNEYYQCPDCHNYYKDANGTQATSVEAETLPTDLDNHNLQKYTNAKTANCMETGLIDSWKCSRCHKIFSDDQGTTEIQEADTVQEKDTHNHKITPLTMIDMIAADCDHDGRNRYYKCEACGKFFTDPAGQNDTTEAEQVVPALGHLWNTDPEYIWSNENHTITAHLYCGRNTEHVITEEVETVESIITPPTCTATGVARYTATFTNDPTKNAYNYTTPFTVQKTTSDVDKIPHKLTKHDAVSPTCSATGNIDYWTCSVCGGYFTDKFGIESTTAQNVVLAIVPSAHNYGEWEDDGDSGHKRVCSYNTSHVETGEHTYAEIPDVNYLVSQADCTKPMTFYKSCSVCGHKGTETFTYDIGNVNHQLVEVPAQAATCTEAGHNAYWQCAVCSKYFSDANAATAINAPVVIAALGHDFDLTATPVETTGGHMYPCTRCHGYGFGNALGNVEAHTFDQQNRGNRYIAGAATDCGQTATYYYSCVCGAVGTTTFSDPNGTLNHNLTAHTAVAATCAAEGRIAYWECSKCHRLFSDANGTTEVHADQLSIPKTTNHSFGEWETVTAATCTQKGSEKRVCSVCGKTELRETEALEHSFTSTTYRSNNDGTHSVKCIRCDVYGPAVACTNTTSTGTAADCTHKGTTTYTCTDCGGSWTVEGAYGSHNTTLVPAVDATCTTAGTLAYYKCSVCNKMFADAAGSGTEYTQASQLVIQPLGHALTAVEAVAATCLVGGHETYYTCSRCNKLFRDALGRYEMESADEANTPALGHDWGDWSVQTAATCEGTGTKIHECARCHLTETEVIPATGHAWGDWTPDGETGHKRVCANDPTNHIDTQDHEWAQVPDARYLVAGSGCLTPAEYYESCSVCGYVSTTRTFTYGAPAGHTLVEVPAVAATCVTSGNIHYWKCAVCDRYFNNSDGANEHEILDKTSVVTEGGHQFPLIHHAATAATCVTAGNSEYWECEVCGKYFSDAAGTQQITNKNDVIIQPSGHDWNPETITYVWSDDYSKVTATMKCRNDESHVMVRVSNTTAEATNANCTTPGTTTYTAVFTEPFETQTKAVNNIASLGHMLIKTPAKAATCMEKGNIEYWTCSRCSKVFTDGTAQSEITDLSTLTIPIAPNNHAVLTHVPEAPATCTNDGTAEHWVCNACGNLFVYENNVLTEKTLAQLKIDAHHTLTTHVTAKAPTCLAEGNVEYWLCSACDKLFAADKTTELPTAVLSATGHSFSTVAAVEATCEEAGNEAYKKCNNCGLFFDTAATVTTTADNAIDPSDMVTDPIGHDYSARPTFVWNGHTAKATFVCQNDSSHTEEVDCVITETALSPVCETAGSVVYTAHAVLDGHEWTEDSDPEEISATGHKFVGEVRDNDDGTHSFKCVYCDQYGTGEGSTAVVDGSEAHNFPADGWKIGENESCLTAGTESNYCTVCGHKAERERTALGHNFTAVAAVEETCTEDGNTAYWVCTRCGEFFSSNEHPTSDADKIADKSTVVIPASGHDWGEPTFAWTGYTAATATFVCQNDESHEETVICTVSKTPGTPGCEQGATNVYTATAVFDGHSYTDVMREDISQTNHNWGTPVYVWSEDLSTCTATVTCLNDANHKKTETVNTVESISVQPTCTEEGLAVYTASFTNPLFTQQKEYKTLAATGHPENSVHKYEQDPTCTEDGYEAYWKCDVCGKMYDSDTLDHEIVAPTSIPASGHDWGEPTYEWAEDNSSVTATRICGNDGSHVETVTVNTTSAVTTPATCEGKGKTTYTATFTTPFATQTKVVENVDALGHDFSPSKDRVHDLDGDNSHHNYACANGCGAYGVGIGNAATVGGVVECAFGDWIISNNESCTEAGSEWRQCAYCSNKETHPRAALPHTEVEVEAKDATCIADGNKAYTYCSVCGTILSVGGTPETSGVKVYDAAGKELIKTTTKLGHDLTKTDAVAPTCEIAGNIDYWTCSRCGKIFNVEEPAEDTDPITLADIVDPAIGHDYSAAADRIHSLNNGTHNWACANGCGTYGVMENSIPVKNGTVACTGDPATCTQDAHCTVCGGVFTSALGHDYRLQSWTWNGVEAATANFVCSRDSSHTHQETAVITTEPATVTCTEPGKMVYFATVHFENGIYTDKKSVIVPALGHDWDFEHPVYDWDQTKQQCTVTLKCLNDGCTAEYTEIGYNETQTTAATCENAGSVVYTAHFNISETLVSPSITVTLEALGHKWGDPDWHWAEDFSSATVTLTCGRAGCGKVETVNATVTPDTVAPTCEKDGRTVYTATATLDGRTYKDTKLTTQPASGHAWPDQPAFSWTGSDAAGWTAATATFACANNAEHDQTLTCAVTHVTEDPTCEGSGKTTYTATVTFNGNTYTDQKEVTINPTGHSYEFVDFNWSYNESTKVWSATVANFKCANDPTHTATAEATVTSETVEAICEADGSITYTAKVTFEGQEYTDTKVVVLPMLHHNWGDATYTWVKDGDQYKVTALRVCANKPTEHQQTETVTTTSEITSSSGCETQGVRTYTATFHTPFTTQTRTEDVAVAGHMLVHTSRVESTCTAAGNIEYWRCSVCNKIFTDEAGTAASCIGTDLAETVIPAKGHDFVMEGSGMVALDNEDGTHSFKCSRCDAYGAVIGGVQTLKADGGRVAHDYSEWKITKESTCTDQGDKEHVCKVCGHIETAKADLKPHEIYGISAVAPTCTVAGNIAYYYCAVCRRYFSDEAGTTVIALSETVLPALGHDFTGAVRDNGDGTHSFRCSRCSTYGAVIDGVQTTLVAGGKVAHTFDQEKQSREYVHNYANCYEPLTYYKSCVCGAKGTDTFTPEGATALGHDWLEFPEQKATCTQAGHSMYWECQRCHEQGGPENDYHPYVLYPATGHGAYYYDADKSGASADGSIKWEAYSCENQCGDYYLKKVTITSLDANGARVPNVNVRIVDSAGKTVVNDKTNGNGELVIEGSSYSNSLHPGRYDIYLEYVRDGSNYNTHGTVNFADGKVTGSFGKLTPYGGNASGSIGGKPTGEFRCSMCDLNDSMKNKPVIGWFISIIHAFVHAISRISR